MISTDEELELPPPQTTGGLPLCEALARRRSCREFSPQRLARPLLSQLCWSAQGISDPLGFRTAPSAGGRYSLMLLLATPQGVFEYLPRPHRLRRRLIADVRGQLQTAALGQPCVGDAAACFILVMDVAHMAARYGDRAAQYCLLESGHVAQNILLQAVALELAGVPVGAFHDDQVAAILQLPERLQPAYLLPVGHPL